MVVVVSLSQLATCQSGDRIRFYVGSVASAAQRPLLEDRLGPEIWARRGLVGTEGKDKNDLLTPPAEDLKGGERSSTYSAARKGNEKWFVSKTFVVGA